MGQVKQFFKSLYKGWMSFAKVLGFVNTTVLLTLLYFLIVPWIAIPRRLFMGSQYESFWQTLENKFANPKNYHYQF